MEITEVRIKLMEDSDDRLQAFCSITFDNSFVVRDLKIIDGTNGPFVAMPSRKLTSHCHQCRAKNHLKALYCNQCGVRQRDDRTIRDSEGRAKLYADIAHPINSSCREMIQNRVISEFRTELDRAKQPGYVSRYDDEYDDDVDAASLVPLDESRSSHVPPPHMPAAPVPASPVQPAQTHVPAPHMPTGSPASESAKTAGAAPASPPPAGPPSGGPASSGEPSALGPPGGPHFSGQRARESASQPQKPKGKENFGAGIFE
jgi:stage V sporulation protein G